MPGFIENIQWGVTAILHHGYLEVEGSLVEIAVWCLVQTGHLDCLRGLRPTDVAGSAAARE